MHACMYSNQKSISSQQVWKSKEIYQFHFYIVGFIFEWSIHEKILDLYFLKKQEKNK